MGAFIREGRLIDLSRIPLNTAPTRGLDGQNTVICMRLSTLASSSCLYVCSLERNAGKVYTNLKE